MAQDGGDSVAGQVAEHFYGNWMQGQQTNYEQMHQIYSPNAQAIYGDKSGTITGRDQIIQKIHSYGSIQFDQSSFSVSGILQDTILMMKTSGQMKLAGQTNMLKFSQTFVVNIENGNPQITFDVFKPLY